MDQARDASAPRPAGLLRRLAASVYDLLLLVAVWFCATAALLPFSGGEAIPAGTWWYPLYLGVVAYVYFAGFWVLGGQTLGMRAWKLWIRPRPGGRLDWASAAVRFVGAVISCGALGLGFLWVLVDAHKLAWHDRLSGTALWIEEPH